MFDNKPALSVVWLVASAGLFAQVAERAEVLHLDTNTSRVVIQVGKAGAFGFAGHAHEVVAPVSGTVSLDASDPARTRVMLEFDSASLRVTGEGEPARDVPEVQRVMLSERVLDARRYPKITFQSRRVTPGPAAGEARGFLVEGDLSLHGVTRSCRVPVRVTLTDGALTAEGRVSVKQSDFGIEPVTAAGGTIRVKDQVDVVFTVRAARAATRTSRAPTR